MLWLRLDDGAAMPALELIGRLQDGQPSIHANPGGVRDGCVGFSPLCLRAGEPAAIGARLHELLDRPAAAASGNA